MEETAPFLVNRNEMFKPFLYIYRFFTGKCLSCGAKMQDEVLISGTEAYCTKRCPNRHRRDKPVIKNKKYCP